MSKYIGVLPLDRRQCKPAEAVTAEPDLLPLSEPGMLHVGEPREWFTADQMHAHAHANVAHATAAKDAEIEALRAEVERLTSEVRGLRQQYDERTACMIVHRGSALACSAAVRAAYSEEHERAERLAEVLQWYAEQAEGCRKIGSIGESSRKELDRDGGKRARAALHPTAAQDGKESFWPKLPGSGGPDWTGHD